MLPSKRLMLRSILRQRSAKLLFATALLGSAVGLSGCEKSLKTMPIAPWHSLDVTNSLPAEVINGWTLASTLPDQKRVGLTAFRGKAVLVFFGYAQCPDICPTTLSMLARVRKNLGADSKHVQVLFITVDPERDQLEILKNYVTHFDPSFIALRGSLAETKDITERFKVFFQKAQSSGTYSVDHSSGIFLIDPKGQVRALMPNTLPENEVIEDVKQLIKL